MMLSADCKEKAKLKNHIAGTLHLVCEERIWSIIHPVTCYVIWTKRDFVIKP